jgi:hypothetical protein
MVDRSFATYEEVVRQTQRAHDRMTTTERLGDFLALMKPCYDSAPRLQRVYRFCDFRESEIGDRWRVGG